MGGHRIDHFYDAFSRLGKDFANFLYLRRIESHGECADVAFFFWRFGNGALRKFGDALLLVANRGAQPAFFSLNVGFGWDDASVILFVCKAQLQ